MPDRVAAERQLGAVLLRVAVLQAPGGRFPVAGVHGVGDGRQVGDDAASSGARYGVGKVGKRLVAVLAALQATTIPVDAKKMNGAEMRRSLLWRSHHAQRCQ